MTIQEARKTRRPFRRIGESSWIEDAGAWCARFRKDNHGLSPRAQLREASFILCGDDDAYPYHISDADLVADNWEIKEDSPHA